MNLSQEIMQWDEKSSSDISAIYDRHHKSKNFASQVIDLLNNVELSKGATWLLKHHLERGAKLSVKQTTEFLDTLNSLSDWEAKLHALQLLPFISIADSSKEAVILFLRRCLTEENKFVRAWAYNGFNVVSKQHPEYVQETKDFFAMAMRDEAASVKARIRNIEKAGFE